MKMKKWFIINSPPGAKTNYNNAIKLFPELTILSLKKGSKKILPKRNLSKEFKHCKEENAKSMREKDLKKVKKIRNCNSVNGEKFR